MASLKKLQGKYSIGAKVAHGIMMRDGPRREDKSQRSLGFILKVIGFNRIFTGKGRVTGGREKGKFRR